MYYLYSSLYMTWRHISMHGVWWMLRCGGYWQRQCRWQGTSFVQWVWLFSILEDLVQVCAWSKFHSLDARWPMHATNGEWWGSRWDRLGLGAVHSPLVAWVKVWNLELVSQLVEPLFGGLTFVVHVNYEGLQTPGNGQSWGVPSTQWRYKIFTDIFTIMKICRRSWIFTKTMKMLNLHSIFYPWEFDEDATSSQNLPLTQNMTLLRE